MPVFAVLLATACARSDYEGVKLPKGGIYGLAKTLETSRTNANGKKLLGFKMDSSDINYSAVIYKVVTALLNGEEAQVVEDEHPNLEALKRLGVSFQWEKYGMTATEGDKLVGQLSSHVATAIPILVIWVIFSVLMIIALFLPCCVKDTTCPICLIFVLFFVGIGLLIIGVSFLLAGIVRTSGVIGEYSTMDQIVGEAMITSFGDVVIVLTKEIPLILDPIIAFCQNLLNTLDKSLIDICKGLRVMIADLISLLIGTGSQSAKILGIWCAATTLESRAGIWRNFLAAQTRVQSINDQAAAVGINDLLIDFSFFSDLVEGTDYVTGVVDHWLATLESGQTIQKLISQLNAGKEWAHDVSNKVVDNEKTIKALFEDVVHEYIDWHMPFTEEADNARSIVLGVGVTAVVVIICSFVVFIVVFVIDGSCCHKTTITTALWGLVIGVFIFVVCSVTTVLGTVLITASEDMEPVADIALNTVIDVALENRTFEKGINLTDVTRGFIEGKLSLMVPFEEDHKIFEKLVSHDPKTTTLENLLGLSEFIRLSYIASTIADDIVDIGNKLKMPPRFNEPYQELLEEFRNTTLFPVTSVINKIFQQPIDLFRQELQKIAITHPDQYAQMNADVTELESDLNQYSDDYDKNVQKLVNEDIPNNIDNTVNNLVQDVKDAVKSVGPIARDLILQLDWIPGNFSAESVVNIYARARNSVFYDLTNACLLFWIGGLFTYFGYIFAVGGLFFRATQSDEGYIVHV